MNKKYISMVAGAGLIASLVLALSASAASAQTVGVNVGVGVNATGTFSGHPGFRGGPGPAMVPGIFGTVTAINGTSLTVTSDRMSPREASSTAATVYTVNASNATIYKNSTSTATTIANIATGDTVFVQGTVSGTNVTATVIRDGAFGRVPGKGGMGMMMGRGHDSTSTWASSTPPFTGNGEPVIAGKITAISGTSITVTNASNVTYTIDASSATIVKNGTSTAITNLATGDNLVVQGTVDGTAVTASSIIDQGTGVRGGNTSSTVTTHFVGGVAGGFLGAIGGFFKHLFGF